MKKTIYRLFFAFPLFFSCGEDRCKTCQYTSYSTNQEQLSCSILETDYCGEELQEQIDLKYTIDTVYHEASEDSIIKTTYITCY